MPAVTDLMQRGRSVVPVRALPTMVRRRVDRLWENDDVRASSEAHMRFLVEHTERAHEVPELARRYAEYTMMRAWLRWHPHVVVRQRIQGIEWLTTRRDPSRSAVLSFLHHHWYYGVFAALRQAGADVQILALAEAMSPDVPAALRQHMNIVRRGGPLLPTTGGTAGVIEAMRPGVTMAIASDVPGRTPVDFLGRRVMGSFGAARIAFLTNSPVILLTVVREDDDDHHIQIHEPLEPRDFADPSDLLATMLARHGEAVLAWPEALDTPLSRFGTIEERPAGADRD